MLWILDAVSIGKFSHRIKHKIKWNLTNDKYIVNIKVKTSILTSNSANKCSRLGYWKVTVWKTDPHITWKRKKTDSLTYGPGKKNGEL